MSIVYITDESGSFLCGESIDSPRYSFTKGAGNATRTFLCRSDLVRYYLPTMSATLVQYPELVFIGFDQEPFKGGTWNNLDIKGRDYQIIRTNYNIPTVADETIPRLSIDIDGEVLDIGEGLYRDNGSGGLTPAVGQSISKICPKAVINYVVGGYTEIPWDWFDNYGTTNGYEWNGFAPESVLFDGMQSERYLDMVTDPDNFAWKWRASFRFVYRNTNYNYTWNPDIHDFDYSYDSLGNIYFVHPWADFDTLFGF